jgi:hypothetical protein
MYNNKGPAVGSGGSGGSTYLRNLGLPAQLSLLVGNVAVATNFVVALLVPWVEARYRVVNVWFPVYVPIKASGRLGPCGRACLSCLCVSASWVEAFRCVM